MKKSTEGKLIRYFAMLLGALGAVLAVEFYHHTVIFGVGISLLFIGVIVRSTAAVKRY
jgi:hypothetical protein